jgi:hypothetical protein
MYRETMDQATQHDIAAAAAAHQELGPDYDAAIAEGLVDRIGAEIDKRVAAGSRSLVSQSGRLPAMWAGIGIGAGVTGLLAIRFDANATPNFAEWIILVWGLFAVAWLGMTLVRKSRSGRE